MSRSNYVDDCEHLELYRAAVERATKGKRGQKFLWELAAVLDAMPEKRLATESLIDEEGEVCAIGAVCKSRGINVSDIDEDDPTEVGQAVGIARSLAAEIAFMNDEWYRSETPERRWMRMRSWVASQLQGE